MNDTAQLQIAASKRFWVDHPELVPHRRKVLVMLHRNQHGDWGTIWRWKTTADRRLDRLHWLEGKLFDCYCPSCPDRVWWKKMILKVAKKLGIT